MGLGLGSEIDMIALLTSRYFGQRMFGEIYGYFFMIFALGTAVGPAAAGAMFQMAGSYQPSLIGAGAALMIATVGINSLGAYAYPVTHGRDTIEFRSPREPA